MTAGARRELPSLKQIEYFVALAEAGSFRRAAAQCGISQPSLSVQIAGLERRLGHALVERNRGGLILTPAGREVAARGGAILAAMRDLADRFDAPRGGLAGTLRLGASATLGPYLLPHVIARLHASNPELSLYVDEGPPERLGDALARGEYDLIVVQLPARGGDFETRRLFREPLQLIVARDHPFAAQGTAPREALAGETVLTLGPGYPLRDQVVALCETLGARLRRDYQGTSLDALRLMAGMGMGVTFLPALYVRSEIGPDDPDVAAVALEGPRILRSIGLVTRSGAGPAEAAALLAALIHATARDVFAGSLFLEPLPDADPSDPPPEA